MLSHANRDVKLPARKQTCADILKMFRQQMSLLKDRLNVSRIWFGIPASGLYSPARALL